jgi:phosphatidylinositol 4-kinase
MKPVLDAMIDHVVDSLSGEARSFYDREFGFFHEITSISGKLKPFIKRTKAEKKVKPSHSAIHYVDSDGTYIG